jgi:hypothetical protein
MSSRVIADLGLERLIVRLEDDPLGADIDGLLDHHEDPAEVDVLPLGSNLTST